jgi:hypothetical protein
VATGGKWERPENGSNKPKPLTVATGCEQLPIDGKEGVDGSSPSESFAKAPEIGAFSFRATCSVERAVGMEPFMELLRRHSQSAASPDVRSLACDGLPS